MQLVTCAPAAAVMLLLTAQGHNQSVCKPGAMVQASQAEHACFSRCLHVVASTTSPVRARPASSVGECAPPRGFSACVHPSMSLHLACPSSCNPAHMSGAAFVMQSPMQTKQQGISINNYIFGFISFHISLSPLCLIPLCLLLKQTPLLSHACPVVFLVLP